MDEQQKSKLDIIQKVNGSTLDFFNDQYITDLEQIQNLKSEVFEIDIKIDELKRTKSIYSFSSSSRRNIFTPNINEPINNERGRIIDIQIEDLRDVKISLSQKIKDLEHSLSELKTMLDDLRHSEASINYLQLQWTLDSQPKEEIKDVEPEDVLQFVEEKVDKIDNQHGYNILMLDAFEKSYITTILDKNIREAIVSNNHKLEILSYLLNSDVSRAKVTLKDIVNNSNNIIESLDTVVNSISHDFDSSKNVDALITSALCKYKAINPKINVTTKIQSDVDSSRLHFITINSLLNILNIVLENVYQHSNATSVSLSLFVNDRIVECKIVDNGIGISPDYFTTSPWYSNLHKAHEIIYLLNGELSILGNKDKGTSIRISFPTQLNN